MRKILLTSAAALALLAASPALAERHDGRDTGPGASGQAATGTTRGASGTHSGDHMGSRGTHSGGGTVGPSGISAPSSYTGPSGNATPFGAGSPSGSSTGVGATGRTHRDRGPDNTLRPFGQSGTHGNSGVNVFGPTDHRGRFDRGAPAVTSSTRCAARSMHDIGFVMAAITARTAGTGTAGVMASSCRRSSSRVTTG